MSTPQNRAKIDLSILHHARQPASSLIAIAIRAVTASESFTREDQQINADATSAPVVMTLPAGDEAWVGLRLSIVKTDVSANAVSIARAGTDTIEGGTSLSTTTQHDRIEVYWDGSMWRRVIPGATEAVSATTVTETQAVDAKDADTPFDLAAGDRMLNISTTGAGTSAIGTVDTGEIGQEVFIRMTAASGGGDYTMALADGLSATFSAAGDTLHAKHQGGGVWFSLGGTAVVA